MNSTSSQPEGGRCIVSETYARMIEAQNLYTQPTRYGTCAICTWHLRIYWVLSHGQVIAVCDLCARNFYELDEDGFKLIFEKAGVSCADHRR